METELIDKLASLSPWGLAVALIVLMRREIAAVLMSPREDRAVEKLLSDMNEQFALNMKMFEHTNADLAAIKGSMATLVTLTQQMLTEMMVSGARDK